MYHRTAGRGLLLLALASPAVAGQGPEHSHEIDVGLWECDRGYVMQSVHGGAVCVPEARANANRTQISDIDASVGRTEAQRKADAEAQKKAANAPVLIVPVPMYAPSETTVVIGNHGCQTGIGGFARMCF